MTTPSRLALIPAAALAVGLLTACTATPDTVADGTPSSEVLTSEGVDPGPDPTLDTDGVGAWCALVPSDLVEDTVGTEVRNPTASFTTDEVLCRYLPVQAGEGTVDVRFRPDQDHASFVDYRESGEDEVEPSVDLSGIGDEAFYRVSEFEALIAHIVVVRKGSVIVSVDAPGDLDQVTSLARAALNALP